MYQNTVQVAFSVIFLALYTGAINTINPQGDIDVVEGLLYIFTFGFLCDEASKFWKIGRYYIGFWNTFNMTLYSLLAVSLILRCIALTHPLSSESERHERHRYNFALLIIILVGFLQGFVGMDQIDNSLDSVNFIMQAMLNSIMQSPDFDGFDHYAVSSYSAYLSSLLTQC